MDQHAAARADRQAFNVIVLREIAAHAKRLLRRGDFRIANGKAGDLPRGRKIALHQRGRHAEDIRDVVESVRFFVGRQERGDVHVERQQIADRVAVLRTVEAMQDGPAGLGMSGGGAVDRRLELRRETGQCRFLRSRHAHRRHQAAANLADHLFPDLGALRGVSGVERIERQSARFRALVVAGDAGLVDEGTIRGGREGGRGSLRARRQRLTARGRENRGEGGDDCEDERTSSHRTNPHPRRGDSHAPLYLTAD